MSDCLFCKIASGEIPCEKIYEDEHVLAFLDIAPMAPGHMLVIPKMHWEHLACVPDPCAVDADKEETKTWRALTDAVRLIVASIVPTIYPGANVLQCTGTTAGQTVQHLHFHIIPREEGGPVPPKFDSGAAPYANDEERKKIADRLRTGILSHASAHEKAQP